MYTTQETADIENASWEHPHPGERLQIPLGERAGLHIYSQAVSGDAMDGVAVKARGAYETGSSISRRGVGGSRRSTKPKPLKIPAKVAEESEAKGAPLYSPQSCSLITPTSPLHFLPLPEPLPRLEFETDTETDLGAETGTLAGDADTDHTKMTSVSQARLSDFSDYLGASRGPEEDDASVTVVDSDTFMRTKSAEDAYGWEAELDRKIQYKVDTKSMCPCHYEYQQPGGGRRGLLHRVFSVSGRRNSGF
ncbi:hypothetical protein F4804DRAFT_352104 [Jackrogersella minutella]|nr:hypothetical protein F4804DRAFT_352104 [Jackrogersella minutella]